MATMRILCFWALGVLLLIAVHQILAPYTVAGCVAAKVVLLFASSFAYVRFTSHDVTVEQGLSAGLLWLALAIAAEIALSITAHRSFELTGPQARPILRYVVSFTWIVSPTLFARRSAFIQSST